MEAASKPKKKGTGCLIALLIFIVVVALAVVGIFLYVTKPAFSYADAAILADPPNMTASERFSVDADTRTLTMYLDSNDLLWMFGGKGAPYSPDELQQQLAPYRLELTRYGASVADGKITVNAEVRALNALKLPVQAVFACDLEQDGIAFHLESAKLGPRIDLPIDKLCQRFGVDRADLSFTVERSEYPWLARLDGMEAQGERFALTFPLDTRMTASLMSDIRTIRDTAYYDVTMPTVQVALDASERGSSDYLGEAFENALSEMERDSAAFVAFRVQTLAFMTEGTANNYLTAEGVQTYAPRFVPGFTAEAVEAERARISALRKGRKALMVEIYMRTIDALENGELTLDKSGFLNTETGQPMRFSDYMDDPSAFDGWFSEEKTKLIFLDGVPQLGMGYPTLRQLKQNKGALPSRLNLNQSLRPSLLIEHADGTRFLYYYNVMHNLVTLPDDLFRDSYESLMAHEGLTVFAPLDRACERTGYIME